MTDTIIEITEATAGSTIEIIESVSTVIEIEQVSDGVVEIENVEENPIIEIASEDADNPVEIVDDQSEIILEITDAGITPGPQGEAGLPGGSTLTYPAGDNLSGHRIVLIENGAAIYADCSTPGHVNRALGMTTGAATLGADTTIQTGGEITEPLWNWTVDTPVWLSTNGLLTQTVPTSGFSLIIGIPVTETKLYLRFREPIKLV